jgi:hypothetical protein
MKQKKRKQQTNKKRRAQESCARQEIGSGLLNGNPIKDNEPVIIREALSRD